MIDAKFVRRPLELRFVFGSVRLFSARVEMWTWTPHFLSVPASATLADVLRASDGVLSHGDRADGIFLPSYPTSTQLPRVAFVDGRICFVRAQYRRFFVELDGTFELYQQQFSGKTRATLRKKRQRFAELSGGTLEWRVYRTAQEFDDFYAQARTVSARTYQETLLDAGLPASAEFQDESRQLAERGQVRAFLLFQTGRPVAYLYCRTVDGVVFYDHVGFDPDYRMHSPGTVLQWVALEYLFAEQQHRIFDFTEGEGAHKELFATAHRDCADVLIFRRTARNLVLVVLYASLSAASRAAVELLKKARIYQRVKAFVRFGRRPDATQ